MHGRIVIQIIKGLIELFLANIFGQYDILYFYPDRGAALHRSFFIGDVVWDFVDVVGLVGEIGFEFLAAALYALLEAFGKVSLLEVTQHQVFHIIPKAFFHHIVDAFVAEDGEFAILDGQIDEHAVVQSGLVEIQFVEDDEAAFLHIAFTAVLNVYLDLSRGVQLGLLDGLHDASVLLSVQYGDGIGHDVFF